MQTASEIPTRQRAITEAADGTPHLQDGPVVPVPALLPGTVLIKTMAVGLNPSDHKMGAAFTCPGAVVGMDFAGVVVKTAEDVKGDQGHSVAVGEFVCGGVPGSYPGDPGNGAFAEYVRAPANMLIRLSPETSASLINGSSKISTSISANSSTLHVLQLHEAATLGTALATSCLALWDPDHLGLTATPDAPFESSSSSGPPPILIYGGSTSTGTMALQLLALSGYKANLVAVCSTHNFGLARAYGAADVYDHHPKDSQVRGGPAAACAEAIRQRTGGQLKMVIDCIADAHSVAVCYGAIARTGGRYVSVEHVPDELLARRRAVKYSMIMAYEILGDEVKLPGSYGRPASSKKHAMARALFPIFQRLFDEGLLRSHPATILADRGLDSILPGIQKLKAGKVSGQKLVALL